MINSNVFHHHQAIKFSEMLVRCCLLNMLAASAVGAVDPPVFGFSPVFGDYMVLQQSPARAAVYGPLPAGAKAVTVTISDGKTSYDVTAQVMYRGEDIDRFDYIRTIVP